MNVCKQKIKDHVATLEAKLNGVTQEEIETSQRALSRYQELLNILCEKRDLTEQELSEMKSLRSNAAYEIAQVYYELTNFKETLKRPLMKAFTKFIVTDTPTLTSPAGYHPDEKVFFQTKFAVHYNDRLPYVAHEGELYIHQVNGFVQA